VFYVSKLSRARSLLLSAAAKKVKILHFFPGKEKREREGDRNERRLARSPKRAEREREREKEREKGALCARFLSLSRSA
jgi:hypothetical protein